jgi:hypothetical protein
MNSFDNCNNPSSKHKHKMKSKPNGLRYQLALHVGAGSSLTLFYVMFLEWAFFCSKMPHAVSASWNGILLFIDRKSYSLCEWVSSKAWFHSPCLLAKSTYTTSKWIFFFAHILYKFGFSLRILWCSQSGDSPEKKNWTNLATY